MTTLDDDAVNITSELQSSSHVCNDTYTANKEDLTKSTGVVPAKYPPKVKLELFSQLYSARAGSIMRTLTSEGIGAFIVVES